MTNYLGKRPGFIYLRISASTW